MASQLDANKTRIELDQSAASASQVDKSPVKHSSKSDQQQPQQHREREQEQERTAPEDDNKRSSANKWTPKGAFGALFGGQSISSKSNDKRALGSSVLSSSNRAHRNPNSKPTAKHDIPTNAANETDTHDSDLEPKRQQLEPKHSNLASPSGRHSVPTFGETRSKLTRLPYYSVRGRACNVAIVSAADRQQSKQSYTDASLSDSSSEPLNRIKTKRSSDSDTASLRDLARRTRGRISNTTRVASKRRAAVGSTLTNRARQLSRSLLNFNSQSAKFDTNHSSQIGKSLAQSASQHLSPSDANRHTNSAQINTSQPANRNMRRQNSMAPGYGARNNAHAPNRPASVSGQYGPSGRLQRRSPSAASLHYGLTGLNGGGGGGGGGLHSANEGDPEYPVHDYSGYELDKSAANFGAALDDSAINYPSYAARRKQPNYAERSGHDYRARMSTFASAHSLHSPSSPTDYNSPYYDQTSRFSVYQSGRDGARPRSSLAPPKEQLRRILGYQPALKPVHLHPQWAYSRPFHHLLPSGAEWNPLAVDQEGQFIDDDEINELNASMLQFAAFNRLEDSQAIRAVDFHPSGQVYAVGSNSRALRICAYPAANELNQFGSSQLLGSPANSPSEQQQAQTPRVLFKFLQVHRGSIYCVRFNRSGQLLATGSNDQTVHIVRYNSRIHSPEGDEYRLTIHDGTVRDLCFIDDQTSGNSLLLSAGGGDNKIYVTDCDTITPFQTFAGHTQMVMALHHLGGAQFVSGSQDKTIRFWDLRTRQCTSIVSAPPPPRTGNRWSGGPGAPVSALQADHSGRLLVSGHADSTCMLYDTRAARVIQTFRPHEDEVRTVSFSPRSYYLLTGGYDGRVVLSDLQGDLNLPLPSVCVAESDDKIIQARWHPTDFTFVTTSANKTATLWVPPSEI